MLTVAAVKLALAVAAVIALGLSLVIRRLAPVRSTSQSEEASQSHASARLGRAVVTPVPQTPAPRPKAT